MRNALRAGIVLAVSTVVAATAVVVGNAAQLQVNGGQISVASATNPCAGQTLAVTTDAVAVTATWIEVTTPATWPSACVGKRIDLMVLDGAQVRTGSIASAPAAGAKTPVTLSASFTPPPTGSNAVSAVVAGWSVGTSWTYSTVPPATGPITAGTTNTALTILGWESSSVNMLCANVQVSSTVAGVPWLLYINTSFAPWNGVTTGYNTNGNTGALLTQPVAGVGSVAEQTWSYPLGSQRTFQICNGTMPTPPAPSSVIENASSGTTMTLGSWTRSATTGALCVPVSMGSQSGNRTWAVDLNAAAAPFNGTTPTFGGTHGAYVRTQPATGRPGWLHLTGAQPYDYVHHVQQPLVTFTACAG